MLHDNENNVAERLRIGANFPPEPIEGAKEDRRLAELIANADAWAAEHPLIEDEAVGVEAANWLEQLEKHLKEFQKKFKEEKAPYEAKLAESRAKWHPRLERIEICLRSIRPGFRAWIKLKENRRRAEEAAKAREAAEAQRRADQLAEQAKVGGPNAVSQTIVALEATQQAEQARQAVADMPRRAQVRGSLGGRTHSLRTVWQATIVEQDLCYRHFRDHTEVKGLLQRLANAAARGGARNSNLPGCWVYSEES